MTDDNIAVTDLDPDVAAAYAAIREARERALRLQQRLRNVAVVAAPSKGGLAASITPSEARSTIAGASSQRDEAPKAGRSWPLCTTTDAIS